MKKVLDFYDLMSWGLVEASFHLDFNDAASRFYVLIDIGRIKFSFL